MPIVRLDKVSLSFGARPLLDRVDMQVRRAERVCIMGRNGEGKSSLLRLLRREIVADSGEVWIRPGARVAALDQEVAVPCDLTVQSLVREGAGFAQTWENELRADVVMSRLGLDPSAQISDLSGGWRRRAMLGRALAGEPDILLLDEPTNHLDIDAIDWLERFMLEFAGALIFVSHDRLFSRRVATRFVDLDRGRLTTWSGGYEDYVAQKSAALEAEARQAALFDKKLAQEESWIRQGVEARRTRNEGRVRALQELRRQRLARRAPGGRIEASVQEAAPSGKLVFEALDVAHAMGGKSLIEGFSVRVMRGDRIGIIGPNGCGKTTLIKLLVGELEPDRGSIRRGTGLQTAYFDQQRDRLDPAASVMDSVTEGGGETVTIGGRSRHVAGYLRDFLFPPERLRAPVASLSGGERNRLLLARLFARPSNLLIMDEPTNDLDAQSLVLLEELVADYAGTLVLVSHDRTFLDNVVSGTLVFEGDARVNEYVGGYSDWIRQRAPPVQKSAPRAPAVSMPRAGPAEPPPRRLSYNERRELEALPRQIEMLEQEQAQLRAASADPTLFRDDPAQARVTLRRLQEIDVALATAFGRWEALELSRPL